MPLELHCIRHGITKELLEGRFQGNNDSELTPNEIDRIKAHKLDASGFEQVYCSPLGRCVQTAAHLGIESPILDGRIAERGLASFKALHGGSAKRSARTNSKLFSGSTRIFRSRAARVGPNNLRAFCPGSRMSRLGGAFSRLPTAALSIFSIGWAQRVHCTAVTVCFRAKT